MVDRWGFRQQSFTAVDEGWAVQPSHVLFTFPFLCWWYKISVQNQLHQLQFWKNGLQNAKGLFLCSAMTPGSPAMSAGAATGWILEVSELLDMGWLSRAALLGGLDVDGGSAVWRWLHCHPGGLQVFGTHMGLTPRFLEASRGVFLGAHLTCSFLSHTYWHYISTAPDETSWTKHQKIVSVKPLSYNVSSWLPLLYVFELHNCLAVNGTKIVGCSLGTWNREDSNTSRKVMVIVCQQHTLQSNGNRGGSNTPRM